MDNNGKKDEVLLLLGRIEGQINGFIATQATHAADLRRHDERIRSLEGSRHYDRGVAAAIGAIVSFVGSHLKSFIGL